MREDVHRKRTTDLSAAIVIPVREGNGIGTLTEFDHKMSIAFLLIGWQGEDAGEIVIFARFFILDERKER